MQFGASYTLTDANSRSDDEASQASAVGSFGCCLRHRKQVFFVAARSPRSSLAGQAFSTSARSPASACSAGCRAARLPSRNATARPRCVRQARLPHYGEEARALQEDGQNCLRRRGPAEANQAARPTGEPRAALLHDQSCPFHSLQVSLRACRRASHPHRPALCILHIRIEPKVGIIRRDGFMSARFFQTGQTLCARHTENYPGDLSRPRSEPTDP